MNAGVSIALVAVGAACAAYGLKFALSETKMRFHLVWFALAAVLAAAGLWWGAVPPALRWTFAATLLLVAGFELACGAAIGRHARDRAAEGLDYLVVLGAQVLDGEPGLTFARRLDAACAYLADNPRTRCVVCGGQGPNESVSEAQAGRDYLAASGISDERILLEPRSHSTAQNLRFASELVDPQHDAIGIVTNDYHMARSLAIARKAGMTHVSGMSVPSSERFPLNSIVRESLAWTKDALSGNG